MKKMLVVVDYQVDFVNGALGFEGADKLDAKIAEKIKQAIADNYIICYTLDTHLENYLQTREGKTLPIEHCIEGSEGWKLYGETGKLLEQAVLLPSVFPKATFGIAPSDLADWLKGNEPDTIEIVGLVTHMCVFACACCLQARFPNAQIIVHSDMVDSFDKDLHQKALDVMKGMQMQVV